MCLCFQYYNDSYCGISHGKCGCASVFSSIMNVTVFSITMSVTAVPVMVSFGEYGCSSVFSITMNVTAAPVMVSMGVPLFSVLQ